MQLGGNLIQCITFDLDDTLWPCAPVIYRAESVFYDWLTQHYSEVAADFSLDSLTRHRREFFTGFPDMYHDFSWLRKKWLQQLSEDYACGDKLVESGFEIFLQARNEVSLFDGTLDVLQRVKTDYRCGSITNGNADVDRVGIGGYFDFSITAAGAGAAKPSPVIFQAALDAAAVAPENMLHIGDDAERDVRGAASVGINTLWINIQGGPWDGNDPPAVEIQKISELLPLLNQCN